MQYNTFVITSRLSSDSEHLYKPNSDLGEKKLQKLMKESYCLAATGSTVEHYDDVRTLTEKEERF